MLKTLRLGAVVTLLFMVGCLSVQTPEKFVVTHEDSERVQMVSSDDALFWVREFEDEWEGSLQFWTDTLTKDFTENRGYVLLDSTEFTDKKGRAGRELLAEVTVDGVPHRYVCFLTHRSTLTGSVIRMAEYTAPKEIFDSHLERVRESAKSVTP